MKMGLKNFYIVPIMKGMRKCSYYFKYLHFLLYILEDQ